MNSTEKPNTKFVNSEQIIVQSPNLQFKESAPISGGQFASVLVMTTLLLCAFAFFVMYAKRKGWIEKYFGKVAIGVSKSNELKLIEVLKVSKHTTFYKFKDGDDGIYLVESSLNTSILTVKNSTHNEKQI